MRRFKDHILKDKKFLREVAIILIVGIIINAACFFMCSLTGHCANLISVLPYLPQNENTFFDESMVNTVLEEINNKYPDDDIYNQKYIISLGAEYNWYTYNDYVQVPTYRVYIIPNSDNIASTWSSGANFENFVFDNSNYWIELNVIPWTSYVVQPNNQNGFHYYCNKSSSSGVTALRLFGAYSPISISNKFYDVQVPGWNYPVYVNVPITTTDPQLTTGYVLSYNTDIIYPGDFTDLPSLDELLDNISNTFTGGSSGTTNTPDQNKTDIQNFADFFNNLQSSINSNLNNLGQNIKGWFDNLQKKLTDVANSISQNIYNGFSTLMANIKEFFGPKLDAIIEKLNYITEPFDQEQINDFIESSDIYSDINSIQTSVTSFTSSLTGVNEPNSYSITLHIEDIGILHQEEPFVLSFDILNDVKVYIRGFLWCFCTYGLFISIVDSFANYINGGSGEDD